MGADLIFSANVVVPIFLLIILGYFLTRIKLWDGHFLKVANEVCFKCLLPVLLFYNVATANIFEVFNLKLIVYVCLCACLLCGSLFLIVPIFVKDTYLVFEPLQPLPFWLKPPEKSLWDPL